MKEAVLQIRIESELKRQAEELYKELGTTFSEVVRILAKKSVNERQLPFKIISIKEPKGFGLLHKYAKDEYAKMSFEDIKKSAIKKHIGKKYGKIN